MEVRMWQATAVAQGERAEVNAADVSWASEETTPQSAQITEVCRCGHIIHIEEATYDEAWTALLAARKAHHHAT